jgi:hypothetical protein
MGTRGDGGEGQRLTLPHHQENRKKCYIASLNFKNLFHKKMGRIGNSFQDVL